MACWWGHVAVPWTPSRVGHRVARVLENVAVDIRVYAALLSLVALLSILRYCIFVVSELRSKATGALRSLWTLLNIVVGLVAVATSLRSLYRIYVEQTKLLQDSSIIATVSIILFSTLMLLSFVDTCWRQVAIPLHTFSYPFHDAIIPPAEICEHLERHTLRMAARRGIVQSWGLASIALSGLYALSTLPRGGPMDLLIFGGVGVLILSTVFVFEVIFPQYVVASQLLRLNALGMKDSASYSHEARYPRSSAHSRALQASRSVLRYTPRMRRAFEETDYRRLASTVYFAARQLIRLGRRGEDESVECVTAWMVRMIISRDPLAVTDEFVRTCKHLDTQIVLTGWDKTPALSSSKALRRTTEAISDVSLLALNLVRLLAFVVVVAVLLVAVRSEPSSRNIVEFLKMLF